MSFFSELKRRKVVHVATTYLVVAWVIMQIVDVVNEPLNLPEWFDSSVIVLLGIGFPIAVVFAWVYELTSQGLVIDRGDGDGAASGESDSRTAGKGFAYRYLVPAFIIAGGTALLIAIIPQSDEQSTSADSLRVPSDLPVRRFSVDVPSDMNLYSTEYVPLELSPDGQRLYFGASQAGSSALFGRSLSNLVVESLDGTADASWNFAVSPDGDWITFFHQDTNEIRKVPSIGGIAQTICDAGGSVRTLTWGPNGDIVFASNAYPGLMRVSSTGGEPKVLTTPDDGQFHQHVRFLPKANAVVFVIGDRGFQPSDDFRIAVYSLDTGRLTTLMIGSSPMVTAGGHLIYFRDDVIWAVRFDPGSLEVTGESVPVLQGVHYAYHASYSLAHDGTLAYALALQLVDRPLVWVERDGTETPLSLEWRPYTLARVSPDGSKLATTVHSAHGPDLWIYDLARGTGTQLTTNYTRETELIWAPDGQHMYFEGGSRVQMFRRDILALEPTERILPSWNSVYPEALSPDGESLLFSHFDSTVDTTPDVYITALADSVEPTPLLNSPNWESHSSISPDGQWLVYQSNRTGDMEIFVSPFPEASSGRVQLSVGGAWGPQWGKDGEEVFYIDRAQQRLMRVAISFDPEPDPEAPEELFSIEDYLFDVVLTYDYDPVSDRFILVKLPTDDELPRDRLVVVQNWLTEVEQALAGQL